VVGKTGTVPFADVIGSNGKGWRLATLEKFIGDAVDASDAAPRG